MSYANAYPLSPISAPSSPPDSAYTSERRRSKRISTPRVPIPDPATRYPSPPPAGSSRSRGPSIDANVIQSIPPFNPNRRSTGGAGPSGSSSSSNPAASLPSPVTSPIPHIPAFNPHRNEQSTVFQNQNDRLPVPSALASYQPQPSSSHHPRPSHQTTHRPASAAVIPVASPIPPYLTPQLQASSRVRQSVGYLPTSSINNNSNSATDLNSAGPYPQLYTPHQMPRQKIYFGPYILLQTLGEGEFGKVKLGVHSERWGEEVAIKLIKRGNVDTAQRGEKVRREIDVLKAVRHPNIVRLYDVIETEKYIGIVLEYASGGELFDHILAHRYLKERDAARLFAQLISGVAYLHAKHIVHRDLKLENLLLDRNRNVIITDFGFANRFELATDDLMATSCGSPCYAAPELVVQEGKYVGTAVDVWSCGVILYAMLAGYLPYDDDPANPEGDNINLLYKYIINTPLSFPDWITAEPRDLLLRMLVPDPEYRCTIEDVTRHSWLRKYLNSFSKSVEELEAQAQEGERAKREALEIQRQFLIAQQAHLAQLAAGTVLPQQQGNPMTRTQSSHNAAASKHRSAIVASNPPNQYPPSPAIPTSAVVEDASGKRSVIMPYQHSSNRRTPASASPTTQTHPVSVDADPFSFEHRVAPPSPLMVPPTSSAMTQSYSAPPNPPPTIGEDEVMEDIEARRDQEVEKSLPTAPAPFVSNRSSRRSQAPALVVATGTSESERRKKANRATVQVEYDGGAAAREKVKMVQDQVTVIEDVDMMPIEQRMALESTPSTPYDTTQLASPATSSGSPKSASPVSKGSPVRSSTPPPLPVPFPATPPRTPLDSGTNETPRKRKTTGSPQDSSNDGPTSPTVVDGSNEVTPRANRVSLSTGSQPPIEAMLPPPLPASTSFVTPPEPVKTHKKAASGDRFSIRSLLGGSGSTTNLAANVNSRRASGSTSGDRAKANELRREAEAIEKERALEEVTNRRKSRRQKALSLQPFRPTQAAKLVRGTKVEPINVPRTRSTTMLALEGAMAPPPAPSSTRPTHNPSVSLSSNVTSRPLSARTTTTKGSSEADAGWNSKQTSTTGSGKAKAVMDWFRRRSTRGLPEGLPIPTDFDRPQPLPTKPSISTSTSIVTQEKATPIPSSPILPASTSMRKAPSVIVTAAVAPAPERYAIEANGERSSMTSRSASGAQSHLSQLSQLTTSTVATTVSNSSSTILATIPTSPTSVVSSPPTGSALGGALGAAFTKSKLKFHQGALDKSAVTSRSPDLVMRDIRKALWNLGIESIVEDDYKLKCVRKKRKKVSTTTSGPAPGYTTSASLRSNLNSYSLSPATATTTSRPTSSQQSPLQSIPSSPSSASFSPTQGSVGMLPSPSTTSFRNFFSGGRKNSIRSGSPGSPFFSGGAGSGQASPSLTGGGEDSYDPLSSPLPPFSPSPLLSSPQAQPQTRYGPPQKDTGEEVKFFIEVMKVKELEGVWCVDLKRLKGESKAWKFVYGVVLEGCQLGGGKE